MNKQINWPPYTQEQLDKLIEETILQTAGLMKSKGAEYAHGSDRLDNFRRNAVSLAVEPETVWAVYAAKHWDAITTYVKDVQAGRERMYSESIKGRFHDLINYALLGIAMVEARESFRQGSLTFGADTPAPAIKWYPAEEAFTDIDSQDHRV